MKKTILYLTVVSLVLIFAGCSEDSVSPLNDDESQVELIRRLKTPAAEEDLTTALIPGDGELVDSRYPQAGLCTVYFINQSKLYGGSGINIPNGASLMIPYASLTPPTELWGQNVAITMLVEKDESTNELIYTFGPHGCVFSTPTQLWLSWKDLECENATLFYLDDEGNRVEQLPDNVDVFNKKMLITIDHFSRYAVAYSN